jgi:type IV pilus assembly protein PilM
LKDSDTLSFLDRIQRWIKEPPPEYLFEVSESALAWAQPRDAGNIRLQEFTTKALTVSPVAPNFTRYDLFQAALPKGANGGSRGRAGLIIPDYAARLAVLDFEEFPGDEEQRLSLVKFRLRKSVPFAIDDAQVSCFVQAKDASDKGIEVLAAVLSRTVLEEYEGLLRNAGFQVGLVIPSSFAVLPLFANSPGVLTLFAKLSGSILSVMLLEQRRVRVVRCIDLSSEEAEPPEGYSLISTILQQTVAFAEDELQRPVQRMLLCGFGGDTEELGEAFQKEFGFTWAALDSRIGPAGQESAGLMGLLEQYRV